MQATFPSTISKSTISELWVLVGSMCIAGVWLFCYSVNSLLGDSLIRYCKFLIHHCRTIVSPLSGFTMTRVFRELTLFRYWLIRDCVISYFVIENS